MGNRLFYFFIGALIGSGVLLLVLHFVSGLASPWSAQDNKNKYEEAVSSDLKKPTPYIYTSGEVEIRAEGSGPYLIIYNNLAELSELLMVVERDRTGEIMWMGTD